jgi:peptide/nickel transport system substrate-binding protein
VNRKVGMLAAGLLAVVATLALSFTLGACGSKSPVTNSSSGPTTASTFTYCTYTEVIADWDPASEFAEETLVMNNTYETLTRWNAATSNVEPLLAESWSQSNEGRVWTFHLRKNVVFHTGRPLTAQTAKEAFDRTIKLGQGAAYMYAPVAKITTPDAYTLVFHLKYAAPMDLINSSGYGAFIYDTQAAGSSNLAKWFAAGHDAGTGPYTVQSWHPGQDVEVVLDSYPNYWGGWSGPHYKRIVFRVVRQDATAVQLARSGQVSFIQQLGPQPFISLQNAQGLQTTSDRSWNNLLLFLNCASGPLSNVTVRQAVASAINYEGIIPPGLMGYSDSLPQYAYAPDQAKKLLAQAGYGPSAKPISLKLTYTQGDSNEQVIATLMKSELAAVGINLSVKGLTTATKYAESRSANIGERPDMTVLYWWPLYPDPQTWFYDCLHTEATPFFNLAYYSNPILDKQVVTVEQYVATNRAKAEELYRQMQLEVYRDVPIISLYTTDARHVLQGSVKGYHFNPAYDPAVFVYGLQP